MDTSVSAGLVFLSFKTDLVTFNLDPLDLLRVVVGAVARRVGVFVPRGVSHMDCYGIVAEHNFVNSCASVAAEIT